jgi:hypothetical protein
VRSARHVGARLFEDGSHTAILGLHYGSHQPSSASSRTARVHELLDPLGQASRLHAELRKLGLQSSVALRALDQLAAGVIVTQGDRRVIELKRAAEEIIRRNDGLGIRKGKLRASRLRGHETRSADRRCDPARKTSAKPGRMLIGRPSGGLAYIVTAASLGVSLAV